MSARARVGAALLGLSASLLAPAHAPLHAQARADRGAAALVQAVDAIGVTTRVLMIGAHPDDEDTNLIAALARGRHVETAYLSLTRGDGGQNLIGDELGEALGAIRTEELLAARRVDGGVQFFTRAYDFGFSKNAEETYAHWPKDSILGDVVRVVRAFRPHVIVAVFSGTPRDGHGHHQVSGLLAREAYDVAGDTVRFPVQQYGAAFAPSKFYRAQRGAAQGATVGLDAGAYDAVVGRSAAEIAGESRSQHKSQGFGSLERKGALMTYVRLEAARIGPEAAAAARSLFDGIDTTWARLRDAAPPAARAALAELPSAIAAVHDSLDVRRPAALLAPLGRVERLLRRDLCPTSPACGAQGPGAADYVATTSVALRRVQHAILLAAGVELEAQTPRELLAVGTPAAVTVTLYNRGTRPVRVNVMQLEGVESAPELLAGAPDSVRVVPPGGSLARTGAIVPDRATRPWWLAEPRAGDVFDVGRGAATREDWRYLGAADVIASIEVDGAFAVAEAPVVFRAADPVRGDVSRPAAAVPAIAVTLDRPLAVVPANQPLRREVRVTLRSADTAQRTATVRLALPSGLRTDSVARTVTLDGHDAQATATFVVSGHMAPGRDTIRATVDSGGETFASGYRLVDYEHVRPQRLYRPSVLAVQAVDVAIPANLRVAYVPGVSDVVAPALRELGVDVTVIEPAALAAADLSRYTTVVVGPRAYEAHPPVMAARAKLLDFARAGGTLVVQYQQYELQEPGVAPFPLTIARPHDRVTIEEAPVTVVDAASPLLRAPNRIGAADWDGWVQERALYMPRTFDARYAAPLEMHDPGEDPRRSAILVAPLGRGAYVYTSLAFFRQLPAGVPGAARLFVNLLAAGQAGAAR